MTDLWFDEDVRVARAVDPRRQFDTLPRREKIAIILAANRNKIDMYDRLKPHAKERYLKAADKLINEGRRLRGDPPER